MSVQYYEGVGRRKESTARVRLMSGSGKFTVNDRPLEEYFPRTGDMEAIIGPLSAAGQDRSSFDITAVVHGGGVTGQTVRSTWTCPCVGQVKRGQYFSIAQGRFPHPRSTHQGTQETRSQARAQGTNLHQALIFAELSRHLRCSLQLKDLRESNSLLPPGRHCGVHLKLS